MGENIMYPKLWFETEEEFMEAAKNFRKSGKKEGYNIPLNAYLDFFSNLMGYKDYKQIKKIYERKRKNEIN